MKCKNEELSLENGLKREWIITNGLGGFASSTIIGANTRKYHGLLIAPLTPPARRFLILSKLDESIYLDGKTYNLFTNVCTQHTSDGYKNLVEFEKEYIPKFTYNINGIEITKRICMKYGENTVTIEYIIKNTDKNITMSFAPVVNFRDFHTMSTNHEFDVRQVVQDTKVKMVIDGESYYPVYMYMSEGRYIPHSGDTFKNMFYIEEDKRGFYPEENHAVPGRYEVEVGANETKNITFTCSFEENIEEIVASDIIESEIKRINTIIDNTELIASKTTKKEKEKLKDYIIATDNFIVYRGSTRLHTIIAGYPWFLDWGRDSLISFEGILLKTKRFDIAKEVFKTYIKDIKFGLVPNGYSGFDNRPLYNSVDSSLLLFEQVKKYLTYTSDTEFIKDNLYQVLKKIINSYKNGIDVENNNIYMDKDCLIVSGTDNTQNTWMDAKYNGVAVTPRNGKAVEINAMWYNSLKIMEELCKVFGDNDDAKEYSSLARKVKNSFNKNFYNADKKCLYDVLGDDKIRPNQLFALSLSYKVVDPKSENAKNIFNTVTKKLLNSYGLMTLSKDDKMFVDVYEGTPEHRDKSYHQGITWPWLLGLYFDSFKAIIKGEKDKKNKKILQEKLDKFICKIDTTFSKEMNKISTVGSISELYDSKKPNLAKGAFAQAWSVAEIFRIILEKK